MDIEVSGQRYQIIFGTAGVDTFIEMHALDTPGPNPLLFALRQSTTGKVTISMYREGVPLEVVRFFLSFAEQEFARWPLWPQPER